LSAETALRNTINRWWMHNRLWSNDPDCLLVRDDRTKLTLDEARTMAAVIALSGGMVLSSDDLERMSPKRIELLSAVLPPLPRSAIPRDLMSTDMPETFELRLGQGDEELRLVGLFNFADESRDLRLDLPDGDWHVFEFWEERYRGVCAGTVTFDLVSPHASRVVAARPASSTRGLLGTSAHIGMGVLDVSREECELGILKLTLEPVGRRHRRVYVAGVAQSATWRGAPVAVDTTRRASGIELDVHERGDLVITLAR
jgi:hypothetical protein